jgi:hypothetical protein
VVGKPVCPFEGDIGTRSSNSRESGWVQRGGSASDVLRTNIVNGWAAFRKAIVDAFDGPSELWVRVKTTIEGRVTIS